MVILRAMATEKTNAVAGRISPDKLLAIFFPTNVSGIFPSDWKRREDFPLFVHQVVVFRKWSNCRSTVWKVTELYPRGRPSAVRQSKMRSGSFFFDPRMCLCFFRRRFFRHLPRCFARACVFVLACVHVCLSVNLNPCRYIRNEGWKSSLLHFCHMACHFWVLWNWKCFTPPTPPSECVSLQALVFSSVAHVTHYPHHISVQNVVIKEAPQSDCIHNGPHIPHLIPWFDLAAR